MKPAAIIKIRPPTRLAVATVDEEPINAPVIVDLEAATAKTPKTKVAKLAYLIPSIDQEQELSLIHI